MEPVHSRSQTFDQASYTRSQAESRPKKAAQLLQQEAPRATESLNQTEKAEAQPPPALPPISPTKVSLDYDKETNQVVAVFVDKESGEATHQIPAEELLSSAAALRQYLEDLKVDLKV
jgi:uncharacterized FlaG/YvyC family protein|tara:strand:+ start:16824 stop:17177 length:354 start_codon:yes stop_codon:yes gene_type:complete